MSNRPKPNGAKGNTNGMAPTAAPGNPMMPAVVAVAAAAAAAAVADGADLIPVARE